MTIAMKTKACPACQGEGSVPDDGVGPLLRTEREQAGITRKAMADRVGISASYLYDLELGKRRWTNEVMHKYQEVLSGRGK